MKSASIIVTKGMIALVVLMGMVACSSSLYDEDYLPNVSQKEFEERYVSTCSLGTKLSDNNVIRLIGYTSVEYYGEEAETVKKIWAEHKDEIEKAGCYYLEDATLKIYGPLKNAIVYVNGKKYEADDEGKVYIDSNKEVESIKLAGRAQTDRSIYTKFREKIKPSSFYPEQNTFVFNIGYRRPSSCHPEKNPVRKNFSESSSGENVSCINNHLPFRNCTEAFPQYAQGRCETYYDRCMDYNGWGTNCSGSHSYFVGSDCGVAVSHFECWNEIAMRELMSAK